MESVTDLSRSPKDEVPSSLGRTNRGPFANALTLLVAILVGGGLVFGTMYGTGALNRETVTNYITLTTTTTVFQTTGASTSALDAFVGKPVNATDMAALRQLALPPYGPSGLDMIERVHNITSLTLVEDGKPVILSVGAEYCPYCAIQRWGLVLALMRFGNFSTLDYMTSSADGTDWATFTLHGANYSSDYISLAAYEVYDRLGANLDVIPQVYASDFNVYGNAFPFTDFAGRYVVLGAMLPPGYSDYVGGYLGPMLDGKTWAQITMAIGDASNPLGGLINEEASVITAAICKVTSGGPALVCEQEQIATLSSLLP